MNSSKINEWLQIAASLGVLVGLLVVAYEIRQNTSVARTEHIRANFDMWMDLSSIELESDVGRVIVKAIEDPENLLAEEKFKMNSWLNAVVSIYEYNYQAEELGIGPSLEEYISGDARFYFSNSYARQWFERSKRWISPAVAAEIAKGIEDTPILSTWEEVYGEQSEPEHN